MPAAAIALVLTAAVMHVAWNALTKRAKDPLLFLWSAMAISAGGTAIVALARGSDGFSDPRNVLLAAASAVVHAVYFVTLTGAYRNGDFSVVYPIARGLGVALVPFGAAFAFGELPSAGGAVGVALVVVGIVLVGRTASALGPTNRPASRRRVGIAFAIATGMLIAVYSLVDRTGARAMDPVAYVSVSNLGAVLLLAPFVARRIPAVRAEWRANHRTILVASALSVTGYLLVLFAFGLTKTSYVVAAREISIALSTVLGSRLLGEGNLRLRLAGACVVLGGVALIALGG